MASTEPVMITIGVAGGTGSGKTTLARKLYDELGGDINVSYLVHDSYYKDLSHLQLEQRICTNFDHPHSLETEMLIEHIQQLKNGYSIQVPYYDFTTHTRIVGKCTTVVPRKVLIVEGILILCNEQLMQEMDIKIFVEAEADIRLVRRINRDIEERGRTVDDVLAQYITTVRPMHELYVEPSKREADIVIHSTKHSMDVATNILLSHLRSVAGIDHHIIERSSSSLAATAATSTTAAATTTTATSTTTTTTTAMSTI